jgi:HprK-related kinase A
MRHALSLRVGPIGFRIGSAWRAPITLLRQLYAGYPLPHGGVPDFTVRLEPTRPWRRWIRPSIAIAGDYTLPDAAPLSLAHALLAAELGMNLQMALGQRRYLLLHASAVERDGVALVMTGHSGAGKSTLSALLGERGWRLMGDEFALLDQATGMLHAFPRLVSLKNAAAALFEGVGEGRLGPALADTPKGLIRHLRPNAEAIARMDDPARPVLILFPQFGLDQAIRPVAAPEAFVRLTQASTNYVAMGEAGFAALTALVTRVPSVAIDYPDTQAALALVDACVAELG